MTTESDRQDCARRALALVREALDRAAAEREPFVLARSADDAALRAEALSLLRLDDAPAPALERREWSADGDGDPLPGQQIGAFRLGRRLGSGGMGTVYRAEPVAGVTRRPVALKRIKRGMDSEEVLARFLREREILARLDHPHIARLIDGGLAEDGSPWFAMELVDGEPLPAWCDARRLDLDARLALFAAVCDAVAYAHRNLVVHRDLKPANVLVTREGEVKLLDFGIAKLLHPSEDAATQGLRPLLTPEYAAPEQFARGAITTQTDVYQLGLLLYELLGGLRAPRAAGEPPRLEAQLREREIADTGAVQAIADARSTTPAALRGRLRGDLERIVRRALQPDPACRYASVGELAEDLARLRRGEPVSATDPTRRYRARLFLRRHRVAAAAAAAVVLALAVGLGLALREAERARRAERATDSALALLEDVFLGADPYRAKGGDTRASDLLARATVQVGEQAQAQPAIAARLLNGIGATYVSLGDRAAAEAALRATVQAGERAGAEAVVATEAARARLAHYTVVLDGDDSGLAALDTAITRLRAAGPAARGALAQAIEFRIDHAFNRGDYAAIPAAAAEALDLHRQAGGEDSAEYALALGNQASLLRAVGREADALAPAAQARRIVQAQGAAASPATWLYVEQQYAGALAANGRGAEAEPLLREALRRAEAAPGLDRHLVDGIAWELASLQSAIGHYDAAAAGLRAVLARITSKGANVAAIHNALGDAELAQGRATEAAAAFAEAAAIVCAESASAPPCLAVSLNRAEALLALPDRATAAAALVALDANLGTAAGRGRQRWTRLRAHQYFLDGEIDAAANGLAPLVAEARMAATGSLEQAKVLLQSAAIERQRGDAVAALADYRRAESYLVALWDGEPAPLAALRRQIAELAGR
ncbi:protein kinase [Tahibacter sp. UC22_41]|uniref:serine/threonine-protein kinase n=1 Tax=Tahibacter sp. UC22_41 TaxID=3350178 RepID=UPI0036DB6648